MHNAGRNGFLPAQKRRVMRPEDVRFSQESVLRSMSKPQGFRPIHQVIATRAMSGNYGPERKSLTFNIYML
jgi:hypothetical protein